MLQVAHFGHFALWVSLPFFILHKRLMEIKVLSNQSSNDGILSKFVYCENLISVYDDY
jgi:hypothetical protein